MKEIDQASGATPLRRTTVGLILATRHDKGYSHSFGPLGLGYLAASLRRELPDVRVVMAEGLDELLDEKPDLVGISAQSETYSIAIRHARAVKARADVPVIIGGVHISMLPESLDGHFDVGVIGEGEAAIVEILKSFLEHGRLLPGELERIPGLCFRVDGRLHRTPPREPVTDLAGLAPPRLKDLPFHVRSSTVCIVTSRGCPYHCTFCVSEKFARRYRALPAERVADDIEVLARKHGARHLVFYDDLLIANRQRLAALIGLLREKRLLGKLTFSCAVRANLVNEEICRLLEELNVVDLGMGVESFSDRILRYYDKSGVTAAKNQHAIDLLHSHGIKVNPSIILAAPVETREDMLQTLRKVFENLRDGKIHAPTWSTLIPYPGTRVWEHALRRGIVGDDMDWDNYANTLHKMYLCEEVPLQEFGELMNEWIVKCTLLLIRQPERGGTFVTRDPADLLRKLEGVYPVVAGREVPELGDDVILQFVHPAAGIGVRGDRADASPTMPCSALLPEVRPVPVPGEFVRAELTPAGTPDGSEGGGWEATGTLTRGEVDTFLFVAFSYPEALELGRADWLEFDSWMPAGQTTQAQLFAVLRTADGSEFLAPAARSLGAPGHELTRVFFGQFQPAPWSGPVDESPGLWGVSQIRIGWGGYHGREGERVTFGVGAPRVGWVASEDLKELPAA